MKETVSFRLNGRPVKLEVDGDRSLLRVLRTDLGLTGTKYGCGESHCGACTVVVGREAWTFDLLQRVGQVEVGDLIVTWAPGQASALDGRDIARGRDVGTALVRRRVGDALDVVVHQVTFAFVFHAFEPGGTLHR